MRFLIFLAISWGSVFSFAKSPESFFNLAATDISGQKVHFSSFQGKVVLVVNTASQCGFTPQLKDLEDVFKKYSDRGLVVLGFPSNDFKQELASASEIKKFAAKEYGTTFPLFEKLPVSGPNKQDVFRFLTDKKPGIIFKEVAWNFEKFLINRNGDVVERWSSMTNPSSSTIIAAIEKELNKK